MFAAGIPACSAPVLSSSFPFSLLALNHSARDTFFGGRVTFSFSIATRKLSPSSLAGPRNWRAKRSRWLLSWLTVPTILRRVASTCGGVAFGAASARHVLNCTSICFSRKVGTWSKSLSRCSDSTASMRSLPPFTCTPTSPLVAKVASTWPPSSPMTAGVVGGEGGVDLAAEQPDDGGAGADVGHVVERQAGLLLDRDGREVVGGADARIRDRCLARVAARVVHELLE